MTHPSPVRYLLGLGLAASLAACGGSAPGADQAANAGAASAVARSTGSVGSGGSRGSGAGSSSGGGSQDAGQAAAATTGQNGRGGGSGVGADSAGGGGLPGGPGGNPADGGGGGGVAKGNPGAPGDVAVFEERGVTYAEFRDNSARRVCVDQGKCTLAAPKVVEGAYSDPTQCPIESMDYAPGAHRDADGHLVFPEGATVTVNVSCLRFSESAGGSTTDGGGSGGSGGSGTTSAATTSAGTTSAGTTSDSGNKPQP